MPCPQRFSLILLLSLALGVSALLAQEPLPLLPPVSVSPAPSGSAFPAPTDLVKVAAGVDVPAVSTSPSASVPTVEPPLFGETHPHLGVPMAVPPPAYLPVGRPGDDECDGCQNLARPGVIPPVRQKYHQGLQALCNRHGLKCWSHPHRIGCGSCRSYAQFIFGSCRSFFGEACNQGPVGEP